MSSNGYANAAHPMLGQMLGLANQASNGYNSAAQTYSHQQQRLYNQQLMAATLGTYQKHWMVNGKAMNFNEFLDEICPDADDPMRTFLILKYKNTKNA